MADSPPAPSPDDGAEIRNLWDRACRALETGDAVAYSELWAPADHIEVIHPEQGDWRVGWDAIGPAYRSLIESGFRCESDTRRMRIHLSPARDMAWATAEVAVHAGGPPVERVYWQTLVFEKIRDRWHLVHGHVSVPRSPPS